MSRTFFIAALSFLCCQRLGELVVARANEHWMRQQQAREFGATHYRWMVLLHLGFLGSLAFEGWQRGPALIAGWVVVTVILGALQILRYWCIIALGKFWNTKILIIPGLKRIQRGPYRWLSHPNYVVVVLELFFWPLLFSCWYTLLWVGLTNALLLSVRIRQENAALVHLT